MSEEPSETVIERVTQLTRWARRATGPDAAEYRERREELLEERGYVARIREGPTDTLVLYPAEWVDDGTVRVDRIDDTDRGIERSLEGSTEDWAVVEEHNRELADVVETEHGSVHGANALALAEFAGNHYGSKIEGLSKAALSEFLTEYFPRNAWPSAEQKAVVEQSIELTFEAAGEPAPATELLR